MTQPESIAGLPRPLRSFAALLFCSKPKALSVQIAEDRYMHGFLHAETQLSCRLDRRIANSLVNEIEGNDDEQTPDQRFGRERQRLLHGFGGS